MNIKDLTFPKLAGIALVVLAFCGPLAYCSSQEAQYRNAVEVACVETGGSWSKAWGGSCEERSK